jgi:hypothetical protein
MEEPKAAARVGRREDFLVKLVTFYYLVELPSLSSLPRVCPTSSTLNSSKHLKTCIASFFLDVFFPDSKMLVNATNTHYPPAPATDTLTILLQHFHHTLSDLNQKVSNISKQNPNLQAWRTE